jgi:hypothetical protein
VKNHNKSGLRKTSAPLKTALASLIAAALLTCTDADHFTIGGHVSGGAGKTLYFENITTSSVVVRDSCVLKKDGSFRFSGLRPDAPDFYRLRLGAQFINLAVDSVESITVEADTVGFARNYTVEGSTESVLLKTLTFAQLKATEDYRSIIKKFDNGIISADSLQTAVRELTARYREQAREVILDDPSTGAAYFALFQQIDAMLIFDPYDRSDAKLYGAVANLWNLKYPEAARTKHLVALFTNSLKIARNSENPVTIADREISSREYFDISLPSVNDSELRMSEVCAGKTVLLDFTAYSLEESPARNKILASLYKKYFGRNFDIYQISLDQDRHFWKNAASNLPWHCVLDPLSVYSETAKRFNVSAIPVCFLINAQGDIMARIDDITNADAEIRKVMN